MACFQFIVVDSDNPFNIERTHINTGSSALSKEAFAHQVAEYEDVDNAADIIPHIHTTDNEELIYNNNRITYMMWMV